MDKTATGSKEFALLRAAVAQGDCETCKKIMPMLDTVTGQLEKTVTKIEERNVEMQKLINRVNPLPEDAL